MVVLACYTINIAFFSRRLAPLCDSLDLPSLSYLIYCHAFVFFDSLDNVSHYLSLVPLLIIVMLIVREEYPAVRQTAPLPSTKI